MDHIENLTKYTANFIDELVCSGLRHVVISPGSRSTPLAVLFAAHDQVNDWIHVDERAAAFFALGIAKETKRPVALVCTSGTAAANYFPAIAEAYYSRIPLIILTADRPHELRDIGASQTMNQINMYGTFVKKSFEMAPPSSKEEMLRYVRNRAARAMQIAQADNPGPVHLNFPFQEPLMPKVNAIYNADNHLDHSYNRSYAGRKSLSIEMLEQFINKLKDKEKGVLVCGPQTDEALIPLLTALSEKMQIPLLADPLSQVRTGSHSKDTIISTYDALFKSEQLRKKLQPDYIIRFGAMPISKHYSFYVQEHHRAMQFVIEHSDEVREPTNHATEYILADSVRFCEDLLRILPDESRETKWLKQWQNYERISLEQLRTATEEQLTEGSVIAQLLENVPDNSRLFVANSMPIRDVDTFLRPMDKRMTIYANRGLSGIDGTIATALGVAAASKEHVFLIIGDLSFYHDLTSLQLAKRHRLNLTILLINNEGGGIFSFLPQAEDETYFEHLFGTPLELDFHHAVKMFKGTYFLATDRKTFKDKLPEVIETNGIKVLEVRTNRKENVLWHREVWGNIAKRLNDVETNCEDS